MKKDRPDGPEADSPERKAAGPEQPPTVQSTVKPPESDDTDHPERVGPYRILQKIGEGGMGIVYEAMQEEPVRRRAALKLVKWGMDTKQVVARFESERQALTLMNHPCIARVFEAGATDRGRPYFAMELVKGEPITHYCDRHRLTTRARLELFMRVCDGVQHAHHKGIIHRDIKPSNVLVEIQDGEPVPKIIDFGVAKATQQRLTEKTMFTQMGMLIGTPSYMSPEQAEMSSLDVDTRTDVYSLGVLLYELLVGALPFDPKTLRESGIDQIRRKIREEEPSKPSTRIRALDGETTVGSARLRRTDPASLRRQLRGDLDWITMKALDKDRTRRYSSPSELAADVERHLKNQPVVASPPSVVYRARKFVRRHRVGVAVSAAGVVVLLIFAVTMSVQARRIARERDRATQEAEASARVSRFLANMLGRVRPQQMGNSLLADLRARVETTHREQGATEEGVREALASFDAAVRGVNPTNPALHLIDEQILARASETIETELADDPLIATRLKATIGSTYLKLGLYEQAEPHLRATVETRKRLLGDDHKVTLRSMNNLAILYRRQGRYDDAERLYVETLEAKRRVHGDDHPDTLRSANNLAIVYTNQRRYDEAEPLYLETLETRRRVLGDDHRETLGTMNNLANLLAMQERYDEAEPLYLEVLETQRRVFGDDHPGALRSMSNLAAMYRIQGRYDEAEPLFLDAIETQKRLFGDDHPKTLNSMNNLAILYKNQGRNDDAERLYLATVEAQRRVLGVDHPDTRSSMNNLAILYTEQGRYDEAEPLLLEILEARRRVLGNEHPETAKVLYSLGSLSTLRGDRSGALRWLREAVEAGWTDGDLMARDPDLAALDGDAEFEAIVAEAKKRSGEE